MTKHLACLFAATLTSIAQTAPVVLPRGIVNAFTQLPAPATVGRGGIIEIDGLNLGPPSALQASGPPLPTQLGDVQVLINSTAAPLFSVSPSTIIAQVPVDATAGVADLVVQRSSGSSPVAHFIIATVSPAIRTADGSGYGQPWGAMSAQTLTLSGSGLGPVNPPLDSGAAGSGTPTAPIVAFVGGRLATATAAASPTRVGEFDLTVNVPAGAQPGDLISVAVGNRQANLTTYQSMTAPTVSFLPAPDGAPAFQAITDTDLNGNFLVATSAKDANGCSSGVTFDFLKQATTSVTDCLTTAGRDPMVAAAGGNTLGALIGPPQGTPPAAISSTAEIFGPSLDAPLSVALPEPASVLTAAAGGNLCAVAPGPPPQTMLIDGQTGAVGNQPCGAAAAVALGGAAVIPNLIVDGLSAQLSTAVPVGQGRSAVLVGDDAAQPAKAEFAIVNQAGTALLSKPFPDGWLPLIAPAPLAGPGGVTAPAPRFRAVSFLDANARLFYAVVSNGDNSQQGFVAFPLDQSAPALVPFPDGWFTAACVPNISVFDLQLSNSKVLAGARDNSIGAANPCAADGFLQLDLTQQAVNVFPLPQTQMDVRGLTSLNDYIYSTNPTAGRGATPNIVYVFDGATGSLMAPLLPLSSITGFTTLTPITDLNWLVTAATNQAPGDGGLLLFDLDNQVVNLLPLPDGFVSVSALGTYLATRKLAALGILANGAGSQIILYDLDSGNFTVVPNPAGVAFAGGSPAQRPVQVGPGGPGAAAARNTLISANTNANTISAVAFDASGNQVGVMVVRIP